MEDGAQRDLEDTKPEPQPAAGVGKVGLVFDINEENQKEEHKKDKLLLQKRIHDEKQKLDRIFSHAFPSPEWHCDVSGNKRTYTKDGQSIVVEAGKNNCTFSGHPIKKLIEAAQAYEKDFNMPGMTYAVEAETLKDAEDFILDLHKKGFEISRITKITSDNGEEIDLAKIIKDIKEAHPRERNTNTNAP